MSIVNMDFDDPIKPEFASWMSYRNFARRVRYARRYVWEKDVQAFLDTVLATLTERDVAIPEGEIFFRAQRGIDYHRQLDEAGEEIGQDLVGYGSERMKPLAHQATEGRANPSGIPVLYLATPEQTAISEVRPWIGSKISVAQFKTVRPLRAVNLFEGHGQNALLTFPGIFGDKPLDAATKQRAVWIDIDNAFSLPVTRDDDAADYVPTQILTELFKGAGYDGIIYRSQFGVNGYNIALFDINAAEAISCAPYQVHCIDVKSQEIGNRWFSRTHPEASKPA